MDPLLDDMLVLRIIRIQDLDRLPPPPPLGGIPHLEGCRGNQHRHRQPLGIDPGLHQLLRLGQVRAPTHDRQRDDHRRGPTGRHDRVSVLAAPILELGKGGLAGADRFEIRRGPVAVLACRVTGSLVASGRAVGLDDGSERGGGGDEEGLHGDGEVAKGGEAATGEEDGRSALGEVSILEMGGRGTGRGLTRARPIAPPLRPPLTVAL